MKIIAFLSQFLLLATCVFAQTPVLMSSQSNLCYNETFSDMSNWTFNASADGTFTTGAGAGGWKGIVNGGSSSIPGATNVTTRTTSWATGTGAGIQKGSQSLVLLSSGSTDNTSSAAVDLFLNFSGLNAGTISFDWASINNSTGDRNGSLTIYASIDGITFTEITGARVLNFTNNNATNGSIANISLPAIFNNKSTARLRFYYYNGTGGTTGSRPKISIDNLKIIAVPTVGCTPPVAQPTSLVFGSITNTSITASFTAPATPPNNYLIVQSNNPSLSADPVNGKTYSIGDNLGDGNVVAINSGTSFTASNLVPSTRYYFFIYSVNNVCTGGPLYLNLGALSGTATTLAGTANCTAPATQPTALTFSNIGPFSLQGSFTASASTDEYLVLRSTSTTLSTNPVNTTVYNAGDVLGNAIVVARGPSTIFTCSGLNAATNYKYFVFALNSENCNNGPVYNLLSPRTGSVTTRTLQPCTTPADQPVNLNLLASNNYITGSFTAASTADSYLILYSTQSMLTALPIDGVNYLAGTPIGNSTVLATTPSTAFITTGLIPSTGYYFYVFAANTSCSGGSKYYNVLPLTQTITTTATPVFNTYFGNLHAHSDYSDGNKDKPGNTPGDNYTYAKNSLCMDFLGISEHNHAGAGMDISKWRPGLNQAKAATTPNFLALYGMEWGVISGGGHVIIYGSDKLLGWEANNYDQFVQKSDYIGTPATTGTNGLFKTINSIGGNVFATLAHPTNTDFNSLSSLSFNGTADSALVGCAVETGPAFSTNTTYSDAGPMSYLSYYQKMLSKGYKIGPTIDHDNHYTTFGRTTHSRLAVLAPSLDTTEFYKAMKARRFYATEDCDTKVLLTVGNQPMGSVISGINAPAITVYAYDPTDPTSVPVIKLMAGTPGSGIVATQVAAVSGNTLTYTDNNLALNGSAYYYADITIAGARTITSPVWYTKANNLYYSKSSGDLHNQSTWGTNADGSGANPVDFSSGTFNLRNRSSYMLTGDWVVKTTVDIQTSMQLVLNNYSLSVAGITGSGTISGSLSSDLTICGTTGGSAGLLKFTPGTESLRNLSMNRTGASASVTLASPVDVYGTVTLSNGTLITNDLLTLKSTATGSARVAPVVSGSISGNVTVERFIESIGKRSWRLVAVPTTGAQTIREAWQDSGLNRAGFGTIITSNLYTASNGFDLASRSSSILVHKQGGVAGPSWTSNTITNTNNTSLSANSGYLVYVRGDRSATRTNSIINETVLRSTGTLRSGTQPAITVSAAGTGYTCVCNPFVSPIDFESLVTTPNLNHQMYVWDPRAGGTFGLGGFRMVDRINATTYQATPALQTALNPSSLRYIQSGQCVFLKAFGSDANVVIGENAKTASLPAVNMVRSQSDEKQLIINLLQADTIGTVIDGARVKFDSSYSSSVTGEDVIKMMNFGENIALKRQGYLLVVEKRPDILPNDTIYINLAGTQVKNYKLAIEAENLGGKTATLVDRYTGIHTNLDLTTTNYVDFTTSNDTSSAGDRFNIVFARQQTLPVTFRTIKATKSGFEIIVQWKATDAEIVKYFEIEKSKDGKGFSRVATLPSDRNQHEYKWLDEKANQGENYYRIKSINNDGSFNYTNIAKITIDETGPVISIYPNPIVDRVINLDLTNQLYGSYTYKLTDVSGRLLLFNKFYHSEINTKKGIRLPASVTSGYYFLDVTMPDGNMKTMKVII